MFQAYLQLLLAALAFAAPIADEQATVMGMNPAQQYGTGGGILGFIVLVLDIIVWSKLDLLVDGMYDKAKTFANPAFTVEVLKSSRPPLHKLAWSVLVFIFPVVGVILYYLFSDRKKWNSNGYEAIP